MTENSRQKSVFLIIGQFLSIALSMIMCNISYGSVATSIWKDIVTKNTVVEVKPKHPFDGVVEYDQFYYENGKPYICINRDSKTSYYSEKHGQCVIGSPDPESITVYKGITCQEALDMEYGKGQVFLTEYHERKIISTISKRTYLQLYFKYQQKQFSDDSGVEP